MKSYLIAIVLGLFFLSVSASGAFSSQVSSVFGTDWQAASVAIVFLTLLIVAIVYMIAIPSQNMQLKAWASHELLQAIGTLLLVVFLIAFANIFEFMVSGILTIGGGGCTGTPCHLAAAEAYASSLDASAYSAMQAEIVNAVNAGYAASIQTGWQTDDLPWIGYSERPEAGEYMTYEHSALLVDSLYSVTGYSTILGGLGGLIAPTLFVWGILGRAFFLTRKLGGLLIATAIGMYFIFPLTYVLASFAFTLSPPSSPPPISTNGLCPSACSVPLSPLYTSNGADKTLACNSASSTGCGYADPTANPISISPNYCDPICRVKNFDEASPQVCDNIRTACMACPDNCKVQISTSSSFATSNGQTIDCSSCSRANQNQLPKAVLSGSVAGLVTGDEEAVVGRLYALIIVLPLFGLLLTAAFIRGFSPLLGGDVELTGLMKVL